MRTTRVGFVAVAVLIAAFGFALVGSGAAVAAPGNGAQQEGDQAIKIHDCYDDGTSTQCIDVTGEEHVVTTPTGDTVYQVNVQSECLTVTDDATGDLVYQACDAGHEVDYTDPTGNDLMYVFHLTGTGTDGSTTCTVTIAFHFANGQVQYDNFTDTCGV